MLRFSNLRVDLDRTDLVCTSKSLSLKHSSIFLYLLGKTEKQIKNLGITRNYTLNKVLTILISLFCHNSKTVIKVFIEMYY